MNSPRGLGVRLRCVAYQAVRSRPNQQVRARTGACPVL